MTLPVTLMEARPTRRTPNVFVIGAGRVATALSGALRRSGVPVLGLWGRQPEQARTAAAIAGVAAYSAAPPDLLLEADAVILAVNDDALAEVAGTLVGTGLITRTHHVLLQCSGARAARETFAGVAEKCAGVGTLHPLRSFATHPARSAGAQATHPARSAGAQAEPRAAAMTLGGTVFGVEGDAAGKATAIDLVHALGGRVLELLSGEMALYHAAAAMASNYLVALLDAAAEALGAAGVPREQALTALLPLVEGTVENLWRAGIPGALTGPIARGDERTVARHLEALERRLPELLPLYRAAGRRAVAVARARAGAPEEALGRIAGMLADPR